MKSLSLPAFLKSELVLCAAALLALASCFFVKPDAAYLSYIDLRTLALLFSLMAVMSGFRAQGVFANLGRRLLLKAGSIGGVAAVLVLLCFFCSMLITNDVALITFVPFTFAVMDMLEPRLRQKWLLPLVCMQTLAANTGSMFTPIGNPQNLFLYSLSGLSLPSFLLLMLPYTALALLLLIAWIFALSRYGSPLPCRRSALNLPDFVRPHGGKLLLYAVLFVFCLLSVIRVLPYQLLFAVVLACLLIFDRGIVSRIDYSLLFTFVAFFVFVGNLGRLEGFSRWLSSVLSGRVVPVAVLASQLISNVPAALLLSGFTDDVPALIVGTNLGGLGTLIASMASLISFRQVPQEKGRYFLLFTVSNLVFLALLFGLWLALAALRV